MSWQQLTSNKGVRWIAAGWTGFILENLILSHNRADIIAMYGDDKYHMAYNILSTAACASIGYGFFRYGKLGGAVISPRGPVGLVLGITLQGLGLAGLSQLAPALQIPIGLRTVSNTSSNSGSSNSPNAAVESKFFVRCPMDFRQNNSGSGISGLDRVSRHPALWSFGLTALGSAITTGKFLSFDCLL